MTDLDKGTAVVRAALQAHMRKSLNEATVAKDLGIVADTLRGFAEGRKTLSPDVMQGLVSILFHGHAQYDPAHDVLRPAMREPAQPLGVGPDPFIPEPVAYGPAGTPPPLWQAKPGPAEPAWKPGWGG
jgi:hypothetical protein